MAKFKKGNKVRIDGRYKDAKDANMVFAIFEFFLDLIIGFIKVIFKAFWAIAKLLFHLLTLGKFRKTNE
jgi:hypothetical protein